MSGMQGCTWGQTLMRVDGVSKTLGGKAILRDLCLEVRDLIRPGYTQGQVIGLLGPSGMGKTTLFRILAGLDAPDTGAVLIGDPLHPVRRGQVGVIAQSYPLFAHRTVEANLLVAGAQAGLGEDEARRQARDLLERFGIAEQAGKFPAQLSGGQRQRVAIAQQFICSEQFILMDEPFSGLDLLAERAVIEFIGEIAQTDELKSFIIVTHSVTAALAVCDTIHLMGRDRDAHGTSMPGARIQQSYNLVERNVAWRKDAETTPEFVATQREIAARFATL
jgi:NitT/TauT family transport system ATP-binding protein